MNVALVTCSWHSSLSELLFVFHCHHKLDVIVLLHNATLLVRVVTLQDLFGVLFIESTEDLLC